MMDYPLAPGYDLLQHSSRCATAQEYLPYSSNAYICGVVVRI